MSYSDEALVARALELVDHVESVSEKARRIGVSATTVGRWLEGEVSTPLRKSTRPALERFVRNHDWGHMVVSEGGAIAYDPNPDPEGSPAEQLMHFLGFRVGYRRLAGEISNKDLIASAYTLAREDGFGREEFAKLDAWRDQILEMERRGAGS